LHGGAVIIQAREIPVFLNEALLKQASRLHELRRVLAAAFAERGIEADIAVAGAAELPEAVAAVGAAGFPVVAIAGGDGTMSAAANGLLRHNTVLVPIPLGTLNHFARRLGIDSVERAAQAIRSGRTAKLPVGIVNGRAFLNCAVCGHYPRLVRTRARWEHRIGYIPAAVAAGLSVLLHNPTLDITAEVDGRTLRRVQTGVWIGVGEQSFRLPGEPGPPPSVTLEVVLPHVRTRLGLIRLGARALWWLWRGGERGVAGLEILHATAVRLHAGRRIDVAIDGEVACLSPPLDFQIVPAGLRVLLPPAAA
jgi:undecaprenyl-diphosphatase